MTLIDELRDYAERLANSSQPNPEISSLLTRAADELEEALDRSIVLHDSDGKEIAVIEGSMAEMVYEQAVAQYINDLLQRMIDEANSK